MVQRKKQAARHHRQKKGDGGSKATMTVNDLNLAESELTALEIRAVQLRMSGLTFNEISNALGYQNPGSAHRVVQRALDRWGWNTVDEYRKIELQRLDMMTVRLWPQAMGRSAKVEDGVVVDPGVPPDLDAMSQLLRIMERRARLLGLDAPQALDIGITHADTQPGEQTVGDYEDYLQLVSSVIDEGDTSPPPVADDEGDVIDAEVIEDDEEAV